MTQPPVLKVENICTYFETGTRGKVLRAVDDVSIELRPGEIVGLVGESGCGKSTLGRTIVGLEKARSGTISLDGTNMQSLGRRESREVRRSIQYVFQDPYASLNDRQTIGETLDEALLIGGLRAGTDRALRVNQLLDQVGLAGVVKNRYARELSGGQRQRAAIARSLAVSPRVLICDEPVSALDLSIRAQVMNLFLDLRRDLDVAILFIAHDLGLVRQASSRVYVMYLGKIVEQGPSQELYDNPSHPYTQFLLSSVPEVDPRVERGREIHALAGELPSPIDPPSGCRFRTRCPMATEECSLRFPAPAAVSPAHISHCLHAKDLHARRRSVLSSRSAA